MNIHSSLGLLIFFQEAIQQSSMLQSGYALSISLFDSDFSCFWI